MSKFYRIVFAPVVVFTLFIITSGKGQATIPDPQKIRSLQLKNVLLHEALLQIADAYHVGTGYNTSTVPAVPVNVNLENATLDQALQTVTLQTPVIAFVTPAGNIAIRPKPVSKPTAAVEATVYGRVTDAVTGEGLPGTNIILLETNSGTVSDVNGDYKLAGLKNGTYTLSASFIGYDTHTKTVAVADGDNLVMNIKLQASANQLSEVQVQAKRIMNTEVSVLAERKNALVAQDAISAQDIERTASITTTQALQKVTGVSVKDGKFIAVRGLTERNVVVQLNGSRLSSADPIRSGAVPLDILPAQLLDNISVQKNVLPDKPGDATGALVELKTRSLPDTFMVSFSAQAGWNDNIGPGGDVLLFPNGKLGIFGQKAKDHRLSEEFRSFADVSKNSQLEGSLGYYNNLYLKISDGAMDESHAQMAQRINAAQESIDPYLAPVLQKATPDQTYSLAVSNTFNMWGTERLGVLLGVNYLSRSEQIIGGQNNRYQLAAPEALTPNNLQLSPLLAFREDAGTHNIAYGGVGIVTFKINDNHAISGHYIRNQGYESSGTILSSENRQFSFYPSAANFYSYELRTSIRNFNTFQFRGEHKFHVAGYQPLLSWNYSTSTTDTDLPDFRNSFLLADRDGVVRKQTYLKEYYEADVTRYFRNLEEDNSNIVVDAVFPITKKRIDSSIKTGVWYLKRNRHYTESQLLNPTTESNELYFQEYLQIIGKDLQSNRGNLNAWLTPDMLGIAEGYSRDGYLTPGYNYYLVSGSDSLKGANTYHATQRVTSLYAMADVKLWDRFEIAGGIRVEDTDVRGVEDTTNVGSEIQSFKDYLENFAVDQQEIQWLPSFTATYKFKNGMNLRLGASKTLARPEIVELVTFQTYDASQLAYVAGNNKLRNAQYENFDLRLEYFPGAAEVLSASFFYKGVDHAIERVFLPGTDDSKLLPVSSISFRNNSASGMVYGVEVEIVRNLGWLSDLLRNFKAGVNVTYAKSETRINDDEFYIVTQYNRSLSRKRPLFEQPDIVLNGNLSYELPATGLLVTLYGNYTGKRLVEINTDGTPGIYEYAAPQFDMILSKTIRNRIQVKGFVKNLFNGTTRYIYQDSGSSKTYGVFAETYYRRQFARGRELALGLSYIF